jgi:N-acetylglucosamine kinase-like BadF-type ATPase
MTRVVVGVDAGGTKTGIALADLDGPVWSDVTIASTAWEAEPAGRAAAWLAAHIARAVPAGHDVVAVGVGAQGLDSQHAADALAAALGEHFRVAVAVNDAALLLPAAGFTDGIGLIAGTGSIGVGADRAGNPMFAGGWGGVIGDDAGAPAIVRDATRAALRAHDAGEADDGLLGALLDAFAVPDAERLARAVNDAPTMTNWGPRAPAVFAAADAGSQRAIRVIDEAAAHLVTLTTQLRRRGAVGDVVVAAGSVVVRQPRLFESLRSQLRSAHPDLALHLLTDPPAHGGVVLARRALRTSGERAP